MAKLVVKLLCSALAFYGSLTMSIQANAEPLTDSLFSPDLYDAVQAETVDATGVFDPSFPVISPFWTDLVNTERVSADGEGVYVAVLDTGLLPAWPYFFSTENIAWQYGKGFSHDPQWRDDLADIDFGPVIDDRGYLTNLASGHGSHVTSTIVGFNYFNSYQFAGVAPKAKIIPVLVLDAWRVDTPWGPVEISGGTDEMIAAGINYIAELAPNLDGPVVINMSLGGPEPVQIIDEAIAYAAEQGVIVVASAGNDGTIGMGYPGGNRQVISAGAIGWSSMWAQNVFADVPEKLKTNDIIGNNWQIYLEDFSSRPNASLEQSYQDLDVCAPGAWIVGPYKAAFDNQLGYFYLNGTSMAAPHVSGMAALLLQKHPDLEQSEVEAAMRKAASGLPLPANDAVVAFPYVGPGYYTATWDGGDYGKGILTADKLLKAVH